MAGLDDDDTFIRWLMISLRQIADPLWAIHQNPSTRDNTKPNSKCLSVIKTFNVACKLIIYTISLYVEKWIISSLFFDSSNARPAAEIKKWKIFFFSLMFDWNRRFTFGMLHHCIAIKKTFYCVKSNQTFIVANRFSQTWVSFLYFSTRLSPNSPFTFYHICISRKHLSSAR
jgi:hypothetical protein